MPETLTAAPTRSARAGQPILVRAAPGPPLGSNSQRRRAVGRIGGIVGQAEQEAVIALEQRVGPGALILREEPHALVADWDACWIDGLAITDLEQWRAIIRHDRLASVSGAFAIAWREPDGGVGLARDAIGERSLSYAELPRGGLVFASRLPAILRTGLLAGEIDLASVAAYLTYACLPGRETLIRGIRKLLPGELLRFRGGSLNSTRVWSLPPEPENGSEADEDLLRRRLRSELEEAVRRRLPSGEPVGAFLSGGLDSSLVVALARRLYDGEVLTYSVSFGEGYANELPFSSMVAQHCQTEHRIVELPLAVVLRHLDDSIALLNDPIGDPLTVPNALLFREAAAEVGVVLNGEGGDPCFGGPKNVPMLLAELFGDRANPEADERDPYARERSYLRAHQKCYDDLPAMLSSDARAALADRPLEKQLAPWFSDSRWRSFVSKLMAINVAFKGAHHILPKVDSLSAPFGVVARSPLFDRAIVEIAVAIPPQLKLQGSVEKYLLKQAVRDLLPPAIIERPKSGMLVPVEGWFRGPLLGHARERLLDGLTRYHLFRRNYLERLLAGRLTGLHPRRGAKIWLLVTLESWLRSAFSVGRPADDAPTGLADGP